MFDKFEAASDEESIDDSNDALADSSDEGDSEKDPSRRLAEERLRRKREELSPESYEVLEELVYDILDSDLSDLRKTRAINDAFDSVVPDATEEDKRDFEATTRERLEAQRDVLPADVFEVLEECVNTELAIDAPLFRKRETIDELFQMVVIPDTTERPVERSRRDSQREAFRSRAGSEVSRDPNLVFSKRFEDAEAIQDKLAILEEFGRYIVDEKKKEGNDMPVTLFTTLSGQFELAAEPNGDTAIYTFSALGTNLSVTFEM